MERPDVLREGYTAPLCCIPRAVQPWGTGAGLGRAHLSPSLLEVSDRRVRTCCHLTAELLVMLTITFGLTARFMITSGLRSGFYGCSNRYSCAKCQLVARVMYLNCTWHAGVCFQGRMMLSLTSEKSTVCLENCISFGYWTADGYLWGTPIQERDTCPECCREALVLFWAGGSESQCPAYVVLVLGNKRGRGFP